MATPQSTPHADALLVVYNASTPTNLRIMKGSNRIALLSTPQERGFVGLWLVPKGGIEGEYAVQVSRELKIFTDSSISTETILLQSGGDNNGIKLAIQSLEYWHKRNDAAWSTAADLMLKALESIQPSSEIYPVLLSTHGWMLFKLERYKQLEKTLQSHLRQKYSTRFLDWRLELSWVDALVADAQASERTQDSFLRLLELLDRKKSKQRYSVIDEAIIRSTYGRKLLIDGYYRNTASNGKEGKRYIELGLDACKMLRDGYCEAQLQNLLSIYFWLTEDFETGEALLSQSIDTHRKLGISKHLADSLNNLAFAYSWQGKKRLALAALTEAWFIDESFPSHSEKGSIAQNLAEIYIDIGDYELAKLYAEDAIAKFEASGKLLPANEVRNLLGTCYRELGKSAIALKYHKGVFDFFSSRETPYLKMKASVSRELIWDYVALGRMAEASAQTLYSKELFETEKDRSSFLPNVISSKLAILAYAANTEDEAVLIKANQDLDIAFDASDDRDKFKIERLEQVNLSMQFFLREQQFGKVVGLYLKAKELISDIRNDLDLRHSAAIWNAKANRVFDVYISALKQIALETNEVSDLELLFLEVANGQSINLRQNRQLLAKGKTQSSGSNAVSMELNWLESELASASSEVEKAALLLKVAQARQKNLASDSVLIAQEPHQYVYSFDDISEKLREDEVVLQFYVREGASFFFAITRDSWLFRELPQLADIESLVEGIVEAVTSKKDHIEFRESHLRKQLSLTDVLTLSTKKVYAALDGPVNNLPISILNTRNSGGYLPLANNAEVINLFSISEYFFNRLNSTNSDDAKAYPDLSIFADPDFGTGKTESQTGAFRQWSKSLSRLPWTSKEARYIKSTFVDKNVVLATGREATTSVLLSDEMLNSKVLHIATHGYFDKQTPFVVGLAVSAEDGRSGFLSLSHLFRSVFSTRLVIISGCETNLGVNLYGEGFQGIAQGMLARGAGSVIGTNWRVPDRSTALFMKYFYEGLSRFEGDSSRALFQAKKDFLSSGRFKHPFYWASFVLTSASPSFDAGAFGVR